MSELPTSEFRKKDGQYWIIDSWTKGVVEIYIIKFPPVGEHTTRFRIIARLDPDEAFVENGKHSYSFIDKYKIFKQLVEKLDAAYTETGMRR